MKPFLKVTKSDKFSDVQKTTTTTDKIFISGLSFNLRHILIEDEDILLLDVLQINQSFMMLGISNGVLILNINNSKNIELEVGENFADSASVHKVNNITFHCESAYYELSKDILEEICEAKSLAMKIVGSNSSKVLKNTEKFLNYCRKFYNQFYDNTKYPETADMKIFTLRDRIEILTGKLFGF